MKLLRRILFLLALMMLLPLSARAAGNNTITVLHNRDGVAEPGVVFTLYKVNNSFTDPQEAYLAVLRTGRDPLATATTDEDGIAVFSGLENGNYLLIGSSYRTGNKICTFKMSLIRLPAKDADGKTANKVVVIPKYSLEESRDEVTYHVVKIWKDKKNPGLRPKSVSVQLYRNGEKHTKIRLTKSGNWQYTWTDTDPLALWAVLEAVPDDYAVSYSRDGNTFAITNTLKKSDSKGEDGKLPQTGQLWWPVPLLAVTGTALILVGWLRRKEYGDEA